ncbi:carboxylesterase/lipase family protein [Pontibacter harenae]|uniref:carboxylesterase/lipase family protein n=1 Tax=Pontibacter harenae TaxID=2894083 RepID=UPI001E56E901|nr:carboxylesterase family protein [Pontibacter harenae]MCC9169180.1 carboxylesterase family protein [Pontibacter harenae]
MFKNQKLLFLIITILFFGFSADAQKKDGISVKSVKIQNGMISGVAGTDPEVLVFKGIPYAAPPIGNLRWKAPQPVESWQGIRESNTFSPNAYQAKPKPFGVYTSEFLIPQDGAISEDCLYLNIWTAAKSVKEKRPVIVFIHGGGFVSGSGSVPIYDGEAFAKKGAVFVTFNYRLGIFGFFAHPELTKESAHQASGNYGILDQIAALKWVKKNIRAFGGDPNNVTIAGQSAGSMSVNVLAASPLARGLFNKIIAESGGFVVKGVFGGTEPLTVAEQKGLQIEKTAGAASLHELRRLPAEKLLSLHQGMGTVIVDGYVLPTSVPSIFAGGKQTHVPLLTGYNEADVLFQEPATLASYREQVQKQFGNDAAMILQLYPAANDKEATIAANNLTRDSGFGIQNFAWARMQQEQGKAKAYMYFFKRQVPEIGGTNEYGAFHTAEVPYAYDNLKFLNRPLQEADQQLANLMSSYWINFARSGNPNGPKLSQWPEFNSNGQVIVFGSISSVAQHPYFDALEFLYQRSTK